MKFVPVSIAVIAATLALAPVANAADAKLSDCIKMAKEVSSALESAQPGNTTDQAREQAQAARTYCASSMYTQGVARYSKALQLLGKG